MSALLIAETLSAYERELEEMKTEIIRTEGAIHALRRLLKKAEQEVRS